MDKTSWRYALRLGAALALFERIFLHTWMSLVYYLFHDQLPAAATGGSRSEALLPPLRTLIEQVLFRPWRRWDAVHYLTLADRGYQAETPASTIFPPGTPLSIAITDWLLPGGVDLAAAVITTIFYALFLAFLYQFVLDYYQDRRLALVTVLVTAFLPKAFIWLAPMSESLYMLAVMGCLYFTLRRQWLLAAAFAALATVTRQQGMVLGGIVFLLWLEQERYQLSMQNIRYILKRIWIFCLMPLIWIAFLEYRDQVGLPPYRETQHEHFGTYFTDPLSGLWAVIRQFIEETGAALTSGDSMAVMVTLILGLGLLLMPRFRRLPMLAYVFGYITIFLILGWESPDGTRYKVSYLRQSMVLFPLWVLVAHWLIHAKQWVRMGYVAFMALILLILSAAHSLGGAGA